MKKTLTILLSVLLLSACASLQPAPEIENPPVLHPNQPEAANIRDVKFEVWNYTRLAQVCTDANPDDPTLAWVVLVPGQYENLALNSEELERYIKQQRLIGIYYRILFPRTTSE